MLNHLLAQQKYEGIGVLEGKWDLIRKKLVRRLLEEQDKVLRSYFAQRGGDAEQRGGTGATARARNMSALTCMCEDGRRARTVIELPNLDYVGSMEIGFLFLLFVEFVVN
jgi:hypothetical protein